MIIWSWIDGDKWLLNIYLYLIVYRFFVITFSNWPYKAITRQYKEKHLLWFSWNIQLTSQIIIQSGEHLRNLHSLLNPLTSSLRQTCIVMRKRMDRHSFDVYMRNDGVHLHHICILLIILLIKVFQFKIVININATQLSISMTGDTREVGTTFPYRTPDFTPGFEIGLMLFNP